MLDWPRDLLIAQANQGTGLPPMLSMLVMFGPIMLLFWLMILRPNQRRERDRKKMLAGLRKNDHVITIGGVKGVVANVKPEEDEVVLRVDEATGVKLRVSLGSIARVVAADSESRAGKD